MLKPLNSIYALQKNVRYISKMLGPWDYEVDYVYATMAELQNQIEEMKQKFPQMFKRIKIISFGKRIITNTDNYLD